MILMIDGAVVKQCYNNAEQKATAMFSWMSIKEGRGESGGGRKEGGETQGGEVRGRLRGRKKERERQRRGLDLMRRWWCTGEKTG